MNMDCKIKFNLLEMKPSENAADNYETQPRTRGWLCGIKAQQS